MSVFLEKTMFSRNFINKNFGGADPVIISQTTLSSCESMGEPDSTMTPTTEDSTRDAISVQGAWKRFGKKEKGTQVLSNLKLTVKEGTIYTLLGSSGCGKTTLLSCIVGMTELDQGECKIFGTKPGTRGCGIPGKKVGYMPQEIALYGEFTIKEAMLYFGRINGMNRAQILARMTFLIKFLHLPPSHRPIRNLSGGQQRRVSFAVALLHEPQILILDEPTVGVDPLLRKNIWQHLTDLVNTKKTTVIITTHYIEEANEAHCIGLMRNGRLLAEDSPARLLESFDCTKLEDVFFKLSVMDSTNDEYGSVRSSDSSRSSKSSTVDTENAEVNDDTTTTCSLETDVSNSDANTVAMCNEKTPGKKAVSNTDLASPPESNLGSPLYSSSVEQLVKGKDDEKKNGTDVKLANTMANKNMMSQLTNQSSQLVKFEPKNIQKVDERHKHPIGGEINGIFNRMIALLLKNFLCMWRNIGFVLFIFLLPALQACLFCLAIGGDPTNLPLGVVNYEVPTSTHCITTPGCSLSNMSCNFLKSIPNKTIAVTNLRTEQEALREVQRGKLWGYIVIPQNFSDAMIQKGVSDQKQQSSGNPYEDGFQGTHLKLHLDMTSQQIAFAIQRTLSMAFQHFSVDMLYDCGMDDTLDMPPASFAQPIYGSATSSFREFMAPGIILSIIFFMSVALTGSAFITERKEGMLNRTLVSGVTTGEIITAHLLTQYVIMAGQTMLVLAVMVWIFQVEILGSVTSAVVLTLFQGTCGMAYGFLISVICSEERNAIQMALGSFYPNLLLSGVVWPLESIPLPLREIARFLPQTMACEAMRSIFSRSWTLLHPKVWPGFVCSLAWSVVFWVCALLLARLRKH